MGLLAAVLFYQFGRGLWYPVYVKLSGGQSVEEAVAGVEIPDISPFKELLLLALKEERLLEVWGLRTGHEPVRISVYPSTGYSGRLGPKLLEGDGQIPEGLYRVEYLNPNSSYHLSMKLDYPNAFDRAKGKVDGRQQLGYDIFIHGKSATIGCIPIGDLAIEELFAMVAQIGIEQVEVIVAPRDFRSGLDDPEIASVDWEGELYAQIREVLAAKLP